MNNFFKNLMNNKVVSAIVEYVKGGSVIDGVPVVVLTLIAFYGWDMLSGALMDKMATASTISTLINICIFAISLRIIAKGLDHLSGIRFKDWWAKATPVQRGQYLSFRIAALAIALALIIG